MKCNQTYHIAVEVEKRGEFIEEQRMGRGVDVTARARTTRK